MIKILCIGNSFSQDASALMEMLSNEVYIRNLCIGGCSLQRHASLIDTEEKEYEYQQNGQAVMSEKVSLKEALAFEKWDYVTVQQVSSYSGMPETYYPSLTKIIDLVKSLSNAEILFHQTWSYEKNCEHPDFVNYNHSPAQMWKGIQEATELVCDKEKFRAIPSGKLIAKLREYDCFNKEKGGVSVHRDGYHLSLNYGRVAIASLWIKFFTNKIPEFLYRNDIPQGYKIILREIENLKF